MNTDSWDIYASPLGKKHNYVLSLGMLPSMVNDYRREKRACGGTHRPNPHQHKAGHNHWSDMSSENTGENPENSWFSHQGLILVKNYEGIEFRYLMWSILYIESLARLFKLWPQAGLNTNNGPLARGYIFSPRTTQVTKLGIPTGYSKLGWPEFYKITVSAWNRMTKALFYVFTLRTI